ncbi:unnamed protein product [Rotaria socialis]|uniref:Uncharacterized protein n=1 Tax=Rotaria socialis TaxID=392032 RepID=A0A817T404_9BILA|nr:unnamed protein product [Rotaria socialis]
MVVAGGAAYGNNNNNTDARNAIFAGAVFLGLGVLCCLSAIIHTCANCSDHYPVSEAIDLGYGLKQPQSISTLLKSLVTWINIS